MANEITISSINGTPPYDIYACDITYTFCYLISGSTTIPPPTAIIIPPPLDSVTELLLKIVDANGCEKFIKLECDQIIQKIYEDGVEFIFMDGDDYIFEG